MSACARSLAPREVVLALRVLGVLVVLLRGIIAAEDIDDWHHMEADLLAQIVQDAGSIRRASKIIGFPRSTLSARIRKYRELGVWPK